MKDIEKEKDIDREKRLEVKEINRKGNTLYKF